VGSLGGRVASVAPPSSSLIAAQGGNDGSGRVQRWQRGGCAQRLNDNVVHVDLWMAATCEWWRAGGSLGGHMWPQQLPLHSGVCRQRIQQLRDSLAGLVTSAIPLGVSSRRPKLRCHRRPTTTSSKIRGTNWQTFRSQLFPSPSLVSGSIGRKSSLAILAGADNVDTLKVLFPC
jgi:hypothetical protein